MEKKFNVFKAAKIYKAEEIITGIIAAFLNPRGEYHNYKELFLKLFIETLENASEKKFEISASDLQSADVQTEVSTAEGRRIDMVISTDRFFIPFEVKIWAKDQLRQIEDYYAFAESIRKGDVPAIFYLTADGHKPSKESLGNVSFEKICCISFRKHILPWLEKCIATEPDTDVKEIMEQLRDIISDNFNLIPKDSVLFEIRERMASSFQSIIWTECPPGYLTFTLKKKGMLEFALRIKKENKGIVQVLIICGVEREDGVADYSNAGNYISNHPDEFDALVKETFKNPLQIEDIKLGKGKSIWARYAKDVAREAGQGYKDFAEKCYKNVEKILNACNI
ncbi:MAG: PD-(D/E)XK nuclease family protein [Clostridiales bacterium]|jgi:hypothetical protein|nr:PD-(D/E)XK nuclease family protein [Clostridiales bacterium]